MKKIGIIALILTSLVCCRKDRLTSPDRATAQADSKKQRLLTLPSSADAKLQRVAAALEAQDVQTHLLTQMLDAGVLIKWDYVEDRSVRANASTASPKMDGVKTNAASSIKTVDTTILIPIVREKGKQVVGFLACGFNGSVILKVYSRGNYKGYGYNNNGSLPTANVIAKDIMRMEFKIFNHDKFAVLNKKLSFYKAPASKHGYSFRFQHGHDTSTSTKTNVTGEPCEEEAWFFYPDDGSDPVQVTDWAPVGPDCDNSGNIFYIYSYGSSPTGPDPNGSNTSGLAAPGGGYGGADEAPEEWESTDANGYYESRIEYLDYMLETEAFNIIPCDKLNIMPLDDATAQGQMFKRVAQQEVSTAIRNRLDSIANVAPSSIFTTFKVQSITNAYGPVVNCDYFPVHITTLPTGISADALLDFFRKYTNTNFVDASLGVSFSPYAQGSFDDGTRFYSPYEQSIGALVHLDLINDGTVVESAYHRSSSGAPYKARFTYSTISSPMDYNHPVSGNREFGIMANPNNDGYTFYTMGVDRTTDWIFSWGNATGLGFDSADALWSNVQQKMVNYINNNGGQAYIQPPVKARPKWNQVERYLRGEISFTLLKKLSGC